MGILQALLFGTLLQASALTVTVRPSGLSDSDIQEMEIFALEQLQTEMRLQNKKLHLLSTDVVCENRVLDGFTVHIFNYSDNRMYKVTGPVNRSQKPKIMEVSDDLQASQSEYEEAVQILRESKEFRAAFLSQSLQVYEPMPSVESHYNPQKGQRGPKKPRLIFVGLRQGQPLVDHEIVAVNLGNQSIRRYSNKAPRTSLATLAVCGPPSAGQSTTRRGTAGSSEIEVRDNEELIWQFRVTRPSASRGSKGSGIEVRDVFYKGKKVLAHAHTPILNVQYRQNRCGPYRDWAYEENAFQADGVDQAPGIRLTQTPPRTIIDTGVDRGNFRGIAIYKTNDFIKLTTELSAGWYRYASHFTFSKDGRILPLFQFSGVSNSCVCYSHNHHVYWRFDFDIDGKNNSIQVSNGEEFRILDVETSVKRNMAGTFWKILNPLSGEGYLLRPGPRDGVADSYGVSDLWFLKAKPTEIDDSRLRTSTRAGLNSFLNRESIQETDLVTWYGAHYFHDQDGDEPDRGSVGPSLIPLEAE